MINAFVYLKLYPYISTCALTLGPLYKHNPFSLLISLGLGVLMVISSPQ